MIPSCNILVLLGWSSDSKQVSKSTASQPGGISWGVIVRGVVVQGRFFGDNCLEGKSLGVIVQEEILWGELSGGSYPGGIVILFTPRSSRPDPVDTGRKLNVHKTFRRRPGRLLNALCTFNLRPVSTGEVFYKKGILKYFAKFTGKQLSEFLF